MTKRIATVDAVKQGLITATMSIEARHTPTEGAFATLSLDDENWLLRVLAVSMENPIHKNDLFAPIIMHSGSVAEWSGVTDIERAEVEVISIINSEGRHIPRRINPRSGTAIMALLSDGLQEFYRDREFHAVVGTITHSNDVPASIINRHFGPAELHGRDIGGHNEARMLCAFGKTGAGKTVFVTQLLVVKICAHPRMGFIIPDTQGDYVDSTKHNNVNFQWNYQTAFEAAGVTVDIVEIKDVALRSKEVLRPLLVRCFTRVYATSGEKAETLAGRVVEGMFEREVDPAELTADRIGREVVEKIGHCYAKNSRAEKTEDAQNVMDDPGRFRMLESYLEREIRPYFTGNRDIRSIVDGVLTRGDKIILRMGSMPEYQQMAVMEELLYRLKSTAQRLYRTNAPPANAIVVLDEAPKWIPQGDDPPIKGIVKEMLREARKAGIGVWIVGQAPADVDKAVLRQAHMQWYGSGLGVGADEGHLRTELGENGLRAYKELQRDAGRYFWVGIGLDGNIGHDRTYFAVTPFSGDATHALIEANPHIWSKEPRL